MNAVVHEAINRQINAELTASYSYLQMSAFCARQAFTGCAHWLRLQSQEEYGHAMKLYDFLIARDGTVELQWFLTEQVEEEKSSREIVAKLKLIGNDVPSVLDLDRELGARSGAGH